MHKIVEPKIFYFGTPVVLISTLNEDHSVNLAPISSVWSLNQSFMLGISNRSQTVQNILRERRYEPDKFGAAQLTQTPSDIVKPSCVKECPVQLEAIVKHVHDFGEDPSTLAALEVNIVKSHINEQILMDGEENYIDPDKWNPLIMNFCEFYGIGEKVHPSRLAPVFAPPVRQ
ncbi:flavin reductase family protein [Paenibacillus polymyxa]